VSCKWEACLLPASRGCKYVARKFNFILLGSVCIKYYCVFEISEGHHYKRRKTKILEKEEGRKRNSFANFYV